MLSKQDFIKHVTFGVAARYTCKNCGKIKKHYGRGLCIKCYHKKHQRWKTIIKDIKTLEKMSRNQIIAFLILGVVVTGIMGLFPLIADGIVKQNLGFTTLDKETSLTAYLRDIQSNGRVYIGIHGLKHVCPVCGETTHELACPNGNTSLSEVEFMVSEGIAIFNRSGITPDWYAFPGEYYNQMGIDVLASRGFYFVPYKMGGEVRLMPVTESLRNFTFASGISEYTWNWRSGVTDQQYNQALENVRTAKPVQLLIHIQDFNNRTADFMDSAIKNYNTSSIRCDDIASNDDLEKLRGLADFAKAHNVDLLLAVIPEHQANTSSSFSEFISLTWYIFLISFCFPLVLMLPWALWFKYKRKITPLGRKGGGNFYPKISLILPAYNEEKIIKRSLEQALNQDYKGKLEVIVVDDGSTDNTRKIVKEFVRDFPDRVKLICQPKNMGKPEALNRGFAAATGTISIFQDTDSVIKSNLVSLMIPHFQDKEVGMVAGMIVIENDNTLLTKLQQIEYLVSQTVVRFCQASHQNVLICPGAATAVRTSIAREIPSTDRTVTEDADFSFDVWKKNWKISQEPEAISYTEAPEKILPFIDQRKRWLYGVLQTIVLHKWALKTGNMWVIWAWIGYLMCPLTIVAIISPFVLGALMGESFILYFMVYTGLTLGLFVVFQSIGVLMYSKKKVKLIALLPVYIFYQLFLQLLLVILVFAYATNRGIHVRYGGKIIHAVR